MARTKITVNTAAYTRTHGHTPGTPRWQGKGMWAFTIDGEEQVTVKYGTYSQAKAWAQAQAQHTITVLP
jgi:hypothetical protein